MSSAPINPETNAEQKPPCAKSATAALIMGIFSILTFGLLSPIGLILGIVAMLKTGKKVPPVGGRGRALAGLIMSGVAFAILPIIMILAALLLPAVTNARESAQRIRCLNNMKQIGLAIEMYQSEHEQMPGSFDVLYDNGKGILPDTAVFQCPSAEGDLVPYTTTTGMTGDYEIHPRLTSANFNQNHIIAWDAPDNHDGKYINVLFFDGHVKGIKLPDAAATKELVNALQTDDYAVISSYIPTSATNPPQ